MTGPRGAVKRKLGELESTSHQLMEMSHCFSILISPGSHHHQWRPLLLHARTERRVCECCQNLVYMRAALMQRSSCENQTCVMRVFLAMSMSKSTYKKSK